jgi:predicted dehydrogenase
MKPVRWGVISTANVAVGRVIPGMMKSRQIEIVAIASRDKRRARRWAKHFGIPKAYDSYEALLADPEIEAVYNPLPNHLHVTMTLAATRAGKHVLCEKPMAVNAAEAEKLRPLPSGIVVTEAFMVRHHPQWHAVRDRVRSGSLGRVHTVQMSFCVFNVDPANVRNRADIGGGGLLDMGCYPVVLSRYVFDAEPTRAFALIERDPAFATDRVTSAILDFGECRRLVFTCSTQSARNQRAEIIGTKARIEVPIPVNAPASKPTRILIDKGKELAAKTAVTVKIPACDQYQLQGEAFGRVVRGLQPLAYGIEDSISQMRALDAIFRSGESGRWEAV